MKLALSGKVTLFCSETVIEELLGTVNSPKIRGRFLRITDAAVATLVDNIERVATFLRNVPEQFVYDRDPDDAHYVNLALAAGAKYVVSRDNDLLNLMDEARPEGRAFQLRFPTLEIVEPQVLLRQVSLAHPDE